MATVQLTKIEPELEMVEAPAMTLSPLAEGKLRDLLQAPQHPESRLARVCGRRRRPAAACNMAWPLRRKPASSIPSSTRTA